MGSYRPISNLPVISKLLERVVAQQLTDYLDRHSLLPPLQSGFRPGHSTETAVLRVISDVLEAIDRGDVAALVLLDLSAAFDTVDHNILMERLRRTFGIDGAALQWFRSYLSGRTQSVCRGGASSPPVDLSCGVPQGSVLGPILFVLYTADLPSVVQRHDLSPHLYADDTQVYGSCRPADVDSLLVRLSGCVNDVASWMGSNRLQLNAGKTELVWCHSARRQCQPSPLALAHDIYVQPSASARDLGIIIDGNLTMRGHVDHLVSRCFGVLRQLRSIRRYVSVPVIKALVTSLILCRLDYGNSLLHGLPAAQVRRLQSVQNAAARLVFNLRRSDHVTDALISLHWLRIPERVQFKLAVLVYRSLHGVAPAYLSHFCSVSSLPGRRSLRSAATSQLLVPRTRCSTIGDRSFSVAGAQLWNSLPSDVTSAPSLSIFCSRLKTFLFRNSLAGYSDT